jgi:hypothetical protein
VENQKPETRNQKNLASVLPISGLHSGFLVLPSAFWFLVSGFWFLVSGFES